MSEPVRPTSAPSAPPADAPAQPKPTLPADLPESLGTALLAELIRSATHTVASAITSDYPLGSNTPAGRSVVDAAAFLSACYREFSPVGLPDAPAPAGPETWGEGRGTRGGLR